MNMDTSLVRTTFGKQGLQLLESFDKAMADQEDSAHLMPEIRAWLDEAPLHEATQFSALWGHLCLAIMHEHPRDQTSIERFDHARKRGASTFFGYLGKRRQESVAAAALQSAKLLLDDGSRLTHYLVAMQCIPNEELFHQQSPSSHVSRQRLGHTPCPAYDTLKRVFETLMGSDAGASSPMLRALLDSEKWEPCALLERLQKCRQEQLDYMSRARALKHTSLHYTAQGELLRVMCAGTLSTNWRPRDTLACGEAWHFIDNVRPSDGQKNELKVRLLQSMPRQVDRALERVLYDSQVTSLLDMVFPLTICGSNVAGILRHCLSAFDITRHGAPFMQPKELELGRVFEAKLVENHPKIAHLVHMHLSLFPEDPHSEENLAFLFVAGNDLFGFEPTSPMAQNSLPLPSGI